MPDPLHQEYGLEIPAGWDEDEGGELEGNLEGPNNDDKEPDHEDEQYEEDPPSASAAIRAARARHSQNPPDRVPVASTLTGTLPPSRGQTRPA